MPRSVPPTDDQNKLLNQIAEKYAETTTNRSDLVGLVMAAFDDGIPAAWIGDAMGISEAGVRQIRTRELRRRRESSSLSAR